MAATFEHANPARRALAAIVADPAFGPPALSSPATLSNLLADYLPDSPRDTGPLLAAAREDLPGSLRDHIARGMAPPTAIQLVAADLAARTAFSGQACLWAACELALALGLATADQLPESPPHSVSTEIRPADPAPAAETEPLLLASAYDPRHPGSPGHRRQAWLWLATIAAAAAVAAGAGGISVALLSQHHASGQRQPQFASHHLSSPAARATTAGSPGSAGSPATPGPAGPAGPGQVATEYVADVDQRDWPRVWQLGGGNVVLTYEPNPRPLTYPQMVAAFQHTVSVTITSLTSAGDTATIYVDALDDAGVTQHYKIDIVVSGGRIVAGWQYFLGR